MAGMLTVQQAADRLQVNAETIRVWLREGRLKGIKFGGRLWRLDPREVSRVARLGVSGKPKPTPTQEAL